MKPPVNLSTSLVFRLLLPGVLLAAVLLPACQTLAQITSDKTINLSLYFSIGSILFGLVLMWLDMPIYQALEGRRFWPRCVYERAKRGQDDRIKRLVADAELLRKTPARQREYLELLVQRDAYPLDQDGRREASMPTRLGNLIYEYEGYSDHAYGLDGVFFYDRLLLAVDDSLRREIDATQAVADGALYIVAVFAFGVVANLLLSVAQALGVPAADYAPGAWVALCYAVGCAAASRLAYELALEPQKRFGVLFKALFDQHRDKLKLDETLAMMRAAKALGGDLDGDPQERAMAVWRYLRYRRGIDPRDNAMKPWKELPPAPSATRPRWPTGLNWW